MTDPAATGPHPDLDALADLHADAPEATPQTRAHVSGCPRCTAELAALDRVPVALAAAAAVGPMPVEVVTAIDAALVAEAADGARAELAESAGASGHPATGGGSGRQHAADAEELTAVRTVTPLPASQVRSPWGMRLLQAAAVVVLLLAGVGIGVSALGGGTDGDATSAGGGATADKAAESGAYPLTASGRDWTAEGVAKDAPRLLDGTLAAPVSADALRRELSAGDDAGADGGSDNGSDGNASSPARTTDESAARLAGGPALAECVTALADGPVTPLAVDIATWQQRPAAVIVLPAPGVPAGAEVWVVEPSCSTADARLLYYANVPR